MNDLVRYAVPKINCGSKHGTAFMVTPNIAITATHVITEYFDHKLPIELLFEALPNSEQLAIQASPIVDDRFDQSIVALRLESDVDGIHPLDCISYHFNTSLECNTFGYPPARPYEGTFINVRVIDDRNALTETRNWNLDLRKNDELKDYQGVSGAPLIYENHVVGVILKQTSESGEATRMAAVSLHFYKQYFESCGICLKERVLTGIYQSYLEGLKIELDAKLHSSLVRTLSCNHGKLGFPIKINGISGSQESDEDKEESFTHLLDIRKSTVVLSEPGGGKTYLFNMLAKEILDNPLFGQDRVPIILSVKHWARSFSSLFQGIYNEIKPYCRDITVEKIEEDFYQGKFLLLVDALDEVTSSKDTLIEDLLQKSRIHGAQIIVSCRNENYHKQLYPVFTEFKLLQLDYEQIVQYADDELGGNAPRFLHNLHGNLENLVRNPLFLYMTVFIVKQSPDKALPKNKAELYSAYTHYLIVERPLEKGSPISLIIDETDKERILACYAVKTFRKEGERHLFNECIRNYLSGDLAEAATQEIMSSGLLVHKGRILDFYHPSFNEYFMALSVTQSSNDEITSFTKAFYNEETYYEVFEYLSGLLRVSDRQAVLLDILEKCNLRLYRKCLESRFNLAKQLTNNWTSQYIQTYFEQVRTSYLAIINTAFSHLKKCFSPWSLLQDGHDLEQFDVVISGSMDHTRPAIHYQFHLIDKQSDLPRVVVKDFTGGMTMSTQDKGGQTLTVPVISSSFGNEMYVDLRLTSLGIDSAREVALSSVKTRLKELLEKRMLISFEPPTLVFEYIESVLSRLQGDIFSLVKDEEKSLVSLYRHTLDEIIQVFSRTEAIQFGQRLSPYGYLSGSDFFQTVILLIKMKNAGISQGEYLLPEQDISWETLKANTCYSWELWSDQQICSLISYVYDAFQSSFRSMAENLFSTLKDHMPYYNIGPVKYLITIYKQEDVSKGADVEVKWLPVPFDSSTTSEVSITAESTRYNLRDDSNKITKLLQQLNRKSDHFSYGEQTWIGVFISEREVVRKKVYKQLHDDLQYILGKF